MALTDLVTAGFHPASLVDVGDLVLHAGETGHSSWRAFCGLYLRRHYGGGLVRACSVWVLSFWLKAKLGRLVAYRKLIVLC